LPSRTAPPAGAVVAVDVAGDVAGDAPGDVTAPGALVCGAVVAVCRGLACAVIVGEAIAPVSVSSCALRIARTTIAITAAAASAVSSL
jgi:hypothetical protein